MRDGQGAYLPAGTVGNLCAPLPIALKVSNQISDTGSVHGATQNGCLVIGVLLQRATDCARLDNLVGSQGLSHAA